MLIVCCITISTVLTISPLLAQDIKFIDEEPQSVRGHYEVRVGTFKTLSEENEVTTAGIAFEVNDVLMRLYDLPVSQRDDPFVVVVDDADKELMRVKQIDRNELAFNLAVANAPHFGQSVTRLDFGLRLSIRRGSNLKLLRDLLPSFAEAEITGAKRIFGSVNDNVLVTSRHLTFNGVGFYIIQLEYYIETPMMKNDIERRLFTIIVHELAQYSYMDYDYDNMRVKLSSYAPWLLHDQHRHHPKDLINFTLQAIREHQ